MNDGKIAVRYARALFNLATEEKLHDLVRIDMEVILNIISGVDEFNIFITSPILKPSAKIGFLNSLFGEKFQKITLTFLELLVHNNRLNHIESVAKKFIDYCKKNEGIESAILTTPYAIEMDIRHSMIKHIEKKLNTRIELEEKTNESLIGGFVLRIGNQQIDASVQNQLARIKTYLLNN